MKYYSLKEWREIWRVRSYGCRLWEDGGAAVWSGCSAEGWSEEALSLPYMDRGESSVRTMGYDHCESVGRLPEAEGDNALGR